MAKTFLLLLSLLQITVTLSSRTKRRSSDASHCQPGEFLDLNGDCAKRFRPPKFQPCPELENLISRFGDFELKARGRLAYFLCEDGWQLAPPNAHAACKQGEWDREIPNCVRPGCRRLPAEDGVRQEKLRNGALVEFTCRQRGHVIIGQAVLGCDGESWNGTAPTCREPPTTTTTTTSTTPAPLAREQPNERLVTATDAAGAVGHSGGLVLALVSAVFCLTRRLTSSL